MSLDKLEIDSMRSCILLLRLPNYPEIVPLSRLFKNYETLRTRPVYVMGI